MTAALFNLGTAYGHLAQKGAKNDKERKALFADALATLTQVIRLKPDWPEAHNNLGLALGSLGRFKEAVAAHAEAVRLKPDSAGALFNLAYAYRKSGDKKSALETHKRLQAVNPGMAERLYQQIK
jgi:Flp pilus assembly protein TadD